MANPWFRLYSELIDDPKLKLLAYEDRWHFVALLCCKCQGLLDSHNGDLMRRMVAVKLGLDSRELEEVVRRLAEVDLIDRETLQPLAWDKRQFKSDDATGRVKKWRKNKQLPECNNNETLRGRYSNGNETPPDTDTDTDTDTDKNTMSTGVDGAFEEFWKIYPKKVGKGAAKKAWKQVRAPTQTLSEISTALSWQTKTEQWQKENGQFIPNPATYLNQRRWEDERTEETDRYAFMYRQQA